MSLVEILSLLLLIRAVRARSRYKFFVEPDLDVFFGWASGQTWEVKFGLLEGQQNPPVDFATRCIPVPYARLIHQLALEGEHGESNFAHEAQRRKNYADRVLDKVADELEGAEGIDTPDGSGHLWRSKVLTPILQRQNKGVPDVYAPSIAAAVLSFNRNPTTAANKARSPTVTDAAAFYLSQDPVDPLCIPVYRRTAIYIRELRWYVGVVSKAIDVKDAKAFKDSLDHQDDLLTSKEKPAAHSSGIPSFTGTERGVIYLAKLAKFYEHEARGAGVSAISDLLCDAIDSRSTSQVGIWREQEQERPPHWRGTATEAPKDPAPVVGSDGETPGNACNDGPADGVSVGGGGGSG